MNLRMIQYNVIDGMVDHNQVQFVITLLKRHEATDPENIKTLIDMLGEIGCIHFFWPSGPKQDSS